MEQSKNNGRATYFLKGFGWAFEGLIHFFRNDLHGKIHLSVGIITILLACFLELTQFEWIAIIICISLVLGAEMINHAIEKLCDEVTTNWNKNIKTIKDIAAGVVLLQAIVSVIIGLIIFVPKIIILAEKILERN